MGTAGVVLLAPGVHRGLRILNARERAVHVQQFLLQRLMQPFDLPRGHRRPRLGQPLRDAVLPADPLEQHLRRARLIEPPGELLAVVAEHLTRNPVLLHRGHERRAHCAGGGPHHDFGDDAEPGMVVNPGDDLALLAVGQEQARGNVQLPQFHRRGALPPAVLVPAPAARHRLEHPVPHQHPVDRGPGHTRVTALAELENKTARTPPAMRTAQVTDQRLQFRADPPRMRFRRMRPISQALNTAVAVTSHPPVHRLAGHPETLSDLGNRNAIKDLKNGTVSLLDHVQLPKHWGSVAHQVKPRCHISSGA